jgi:hypothetical protein
MSSTQSRYLHRGKQTKKEASKTNNLHGSYFANQVIIPTEQPPLVSEIFANFGVLFGQRVGSPTVVNLSFLDRSRYFSFK